MANDAGTNSAGIGETPPAATGTDANAGTATGTDAGAAATGASIPGAVDPATIAGPRKRGRPPGSKNKANLSAPKPAAATAPKQVALSVDGVSAILFSIHGMLAGITRVPELALDDKESKQLAAAIAEVGKHYDLTADPKMVAWANLTMTCAALYGSRFVAIKFRIAAQREAAQRKSVAHSEPAQDGGIPVFGSMPPMDGGKTH